MSAAPPRRLKLKDLFCGRGGATKGFQQMGWTAIGYDLNPQPDYPAEFRQVNVTRHDR